MKTTLNKHVKNALTLVVENDRYLKAEAHKPYKVEISDDPAILQTSTAYVNIINKRMTYKEICAIPNIEQLIKEKHIIIKTNYETFIKFQLDEPSITFAPNQPHKFYDITRHMNLKMMHITELLEVHEITNHDIVTAELIEPEAKLLVEYLEKNHPNIPALISIRPTEEIPNVDERMFIFTTLVMFIFGYAMYFKLDINQGIMFVASIIYYLFKVLCVILSVLVVLLALSYFSNNRKFKEYEWSGWTWLNTLFVMTTPVALSHLYNVVTNNNGTHMSTVLVTLMMIAISKYNPIDMVTPIYKRLLRHKHSSRG